MKLRGASASAWRLRTLLADPQILILDEPTSAVEPESEAIVQASLERLMRGRTTFVTSHRLSLIRNADVIVVFEAGKLTERGGIYAGMHEMQMGLSEVFTAAST